MLIQINFRCLLGILVIALFAGCATPSAFDYSAYRRAKPKSILVLPPANNTPDVLATPGMLAQMTFPLAESGYYVFPVAVVNETFRRNGLTDPVSMHMVPAARLQQIFGADAALYVTVKRYGSVYAVFSSNVVVEASAELIDLQSGNVIWSGSAMAAADEGNPGGQQSVAVVLVKALVSQVMNNLTDVSFKVAGAASQRLLTAGRPNGLLFGPRHPEYMKAAQ